MPDHPITLDESEALAWRVEGMDCASCVAKIRTAVERLPGVAEVDVNLVAERLTLRGPPSVPRAVERQVSALGFRCIRLDRPGALDGQGGAPSVAPAFWRTSKARLAGGLAAVVLLAWLLSHALPQAAYWVYLAATFAALVPFGRRAIALARAGTPFSIETLMSVAALGAVLIGAAEEAAFVVLLFAIGELLEAIAANQARAGIHALASLLPATARRETASSLETIPAAQLRIGDIVQVRPGDRLPCDGQILEGHSALDESALTGESLPVPRGPGDPVTAGVVNADGLLRVQVSHSSADNAIARIVRLVEQAAASRAPTQRFIERFAAWWTPAAMAAALLVALLPPLLDGGWQTWIYRALALLLIACPCALVISVPAAIASGLSAGARHGLLIKGGAALEAIGSAKTVAFDKTGTLTQGKPRVIDVICLKPGYDDARLLALAAAVEAGSSHPLALAIAAAASERGVLVPPAARARALPGRAAQATVGGREIAVGSPRHAAEAGPGLTDDAAAQVAALEAQGKTCLVVLQDGAPTGLIALRDQPRADAAAGVAALAGLGLDLVMLTGDNERAARAIAAPLGLDVQAGLLPEDKLRRIAALRRAGPVVMVGDGINDAPALAAASVGVAMGGGTDVALEAADAAILRDQVIGVASLVALSRATLGNVRQNVAVAIAFKAVFLVTTLARLTGLWPAVVADAGATVLVSMNALRLLRWAPAAPKAGGQEVRARHAVVQ